MPKRNLPVSRVASAFVLSVFLTIGATSVAAAASLSAQFLPAAAGAPQMERKKLMAREDVGQTVAFINEVFKLEHDLKLVFGADDGPLFDPERAEILIPYAFLTDIRARFAQADPKATALELDQVVSDVLVHTLFHELGHALVTMFELPVLGREEDAVDALAAILLIEYFEGGEEAALSAADMFWLESADGAPSEDDYRGEHALDAQRYYRTLCLVQGSAEPGQAQADPRLRVEAQDADKCADLYDETLDSWLGVLEPHMATQ